jgi:hypothetical protein
LSYSGTQNGRAIYKPITLASNSFLQITPLSFLLRVAGAFLKTMRDAAAGDLAVAGRGRRILAAGCNRRANAGHGRSLLAKTALLVVFNGLPIFLFTFRAAFA